MSEHKMHVDIYCPVCGKHETLIFLEPVDVSHIREHVVPPGWGHKDGKLVCKECLEVR
jgi:hypothetical protein